MSPSNAKKFLYLALNLSLFGLFFVVAVSCRKPAASRGKVSAKQLAEANNTFALKLYSELAKQPGNLVFSPISTEAALAMASAGASGQTASQMSQTLGFGENDARDFGFGFLLNEMNQTNELGCQLTVANSIWVQKSFPIKSAFQRIVEDDYGGELIRADFAASQTCDEINSWFKKQTHGGISGIVEPGLIHSGTDVVLANAAYFKGRWAQGFMEAHTGSNSFKLDRSHSVSVAMMFSAQEFSYAEDSDVRVLELFYTDPAFFEQPMPLNSNRFSMVILLPKDNEGLASLEQSLTSERISMLLSQSAVLRVRVLLPKFSFGSAVDLNPALLRMGMTDAFSERADFSGISNKKPLFIDFVRHKSWLRVDENGTEAAAGTAVGLTHGIPPDDGKDFNADHPFLFLIRDTQTGVILFLGRVADPSKNE